jgi:tellurite resistance protein
MTQAPDPDRARLRPKAFPPPEFPPRKVPLFARTPPAVFPVILGALGLVLALRRGMEALGLSQAPVDLLGGLVVALWVFAALAYGVKLARRPGVIWDELKVLPGRAGLAAGTAGGLAVAAVLVPYAPEVSRAVLFGGLVLHGVLALAVVRALVGLPPEAQGVTPAFHLSFVGFIIGGLAAVPLGHDALARGGVLGHAADCGADLGGECGASGAAGAACAAAALAGDPSGACGAVFLGGGAAWV